MTRFAVARPVSTRKRVRAFNGEGALTALRDAGFGKGLEVFGFNKGQFSFIDLIDACLEFTGPAEATIATWTAADADLRRAAEFLKRGRITKATWIVDYSFETRQPAFCELLRELFGDNSIRTLASHAKFVTLGNAEWNLVLQSSMNLNQNRRIENFWIADDPQLFEEYSSLVADVFALQADTASLGHPPKTRRAELARIGRTAATDPFAEIGSVADMLPSLNPVDKIR
jgi:hypothetical protein